MKTSFGGRPTAPKRVWSGAVLFAGISGAAALFPTEAQSAATTVKVFDLITYTEPRGFEPTPMGSNNHVTFRRVDPQSWILFSIYGSRAASKDLAAEFAFDWTDLNAASGIAAPSSTARKVGAKIDAREGGAFIPSVGYVDLVDVFTNGKAASIIIECGSADQFRSYQPVIAEFFASLVVKEGPKNEPVTSPPSAPISPPTTTREVDYVKDDFVWTGANGLEYIPPLTTVASGAGFPASVPGVWQNDREQFTLELATDGTYASAYAGSAASGSFRSREAGRWVVDGTKLTLRPESASISSRSRYDSHAETVNREAGGPRIYDVTTLVLEYTRNNQAYRIDGIELRGPTAPWYYTPSGNLVIVFRRTGQTRAR